MPALAPLRVPSLTELTSIPEELRALKGWVCWRLEVRDGKPTKVPYDPNSGRKASVSDPATWGWFSDAIIAWGETIGKPGGMTGMGFVFSASDPYCGIDLDGCRDPETGAIQPWAVEAIRKLDGYTEISPSGSGIHIIVKGALPPGRRRKGAIEMYDSGRFFCMTGRLLHV